MNDEKLNDIIKSSEVLIHKARYAYLRGREDCLKNHFMLARDKDETTILTEEKNLEHTDFDKAEKWFRLVEIRLSVPFSAGFLNKVSSALAGRTVGCPIVSTFSKDYFLISEEKIKEAVAALKEMGFAKIVEE